MRPHTFKAWALVKANDQVAYDLSRDLPRPHVYMGRQGAKIAQSIDMERIVRVLVTITAAKQKRAKRGRK